MTEDQQDSVKMLQQQLDQLSACQNYQVRTSVAVCLSLQAVAPSMRSLTNHGHSAPATNRESGCEFDSERNSTAIGSHNEYAPTASDSRTRFEETFVVQSAGDAAGNPCRTRFPLLLLVCGGPLFTLVLHKQHYGRCSAWIRAQWRRRPSCWAMQLCCHAAPTRFEPLNDGGNHKNLTIARRSETVQWRRRLSCWGRLLRCHTGPGTALSRHLR